MLSSLANECGAVNRLSGHSPPCRWPFQRCIGKYTTDPLPSSVVHDTTPFMAPHERLQSWLDAAKVTPAEMARRCEYDRSNFHKVLNGRLRPTLDLAARIDRETNGTIPTIAWAEAA